VKDRKMLLYEVGIPKCYFPKELWPECLIDSYIQIVKLRANSRTEAALKVWERYGTWWLDLMLPCETSKRIVSLDVNEPQVGVEGLLGRLESIKVYDSSEQDNLTEA